MASYDLKKMYNLALKEGEGLGTAYEYASRYHVLKPYVGSKKILIYGLPEKYGFGLDSLYLLDAHDCEVHVYDERKEKIKKYSKVIYALLQKGFIKRRPLIVKDIKEYYDVIISSEVVQRLGDKKLEEYFTTIKARSKKAVIFFPNGDNKAHCILTKLRGIKPGYVSRFFDEKVLAGFVDMPPFPPGLSVRSSRTRRKLRLFIPLLRLWLIVEKVCPLPVKKRFCHIAYIQVEKQEQNMHGNKKNRAPLSKL